MDICRKLLTRSKGTPRAHGHTVNAAGDFTDYDEAFLDSIVTGDETGCTMALQKPSKIR